jgi:hypothetical protein
MKHFKGFGSRFTKLHTELDADTLLNFVIHCRQNETQSKKKQSCRNIACTQCGVTWETVAIGLRKCDLGLPYQRLSLRQLEQWQSGNFLIHLIYECLPSSHCFVFITRQMGPESGKQIMSSETIYVAGVPFLLQFCQDVGH